MQSYELVFFLLDHFFLAACLGLLAINIRRGRRSSLGRTSALALACAALLAAGALLNGTLTLLGWPHAGLALYLAAAGLCALPPAVLLLAFALLRKGARITRLYLLLLAPAGAAFALVCTNPLHGWMARRWPAGPGLPEPGVGGIAFAVFALGCLAAGAGVILWFCIRHSGPASAPALLALPGVLCLLGAAGLPGFFTGAAWHYGLLALAVPGVICLCGAASCYDLSARAAQTMVGLVRDGYLIVDRHHRIVEHNQALPQMLSLPPRELAKMEMRAFWARCGAADSYRDYLAMYREAVAQRGAVSAEVTAGPREDARCIVVELTPLYQHRLLVGAAVLLRDVTQSKKDVQMLRDTQVVMIERERLASLGQMVGGIAHNLKTPILSIAGGVEALRELVREYDDSVGDAAVTEQDHHEIAKEMNGWLDKVQQYCSYISDMISAVKDQTVQLAPGASESFTIDEFLKRLRLLMRFELKKRQCTLNTTIQVHEATTISGNINALVQVFDNLIINALHAYNGEPGDIDLAIRTQEDKLVFTLADHASGIDPAVRHKLFREMVTTKGKQGTGLGLYLSYSTIVGHFNGQMAVDSEPGKGTRFAITIPQNRPGGLSL